jgi:hypothetical protein
MTPKNLSSQFKEEETAMKSSLAIVRLLCRDLLNRAQSKKLKSSRARFPKRLNFSLEPLEGRLLLSVGLVGIPDWVDQGPAPIVGAQVNVPPDNFATGAVESIAINPNNTAQIYVGTVNGGIWRTNNADPNNPDATVWTPLTDQQISLAMGDIAFSPLDPSGNTLFAGTGSFSSLGQAGGPAVGILRTTDGGGTWRNFAVNPGGENQVKAIVPTAIDLDLGAGVQQMVLVGTVGSGGLYRSNDNGETFALLSGTNGLPTGDITQLVTDPNNVNQYFAGVANSGVYRGVYNSGTGAITWTAANNGITNIGTAGNVQIAARNSSGNTVLFALLSDSSASGNQGAFRSGDGGANWTALATPPALFQRDVTVRAGNTITIDPTNDTVAYIATYGGGNDIFRYNPGGSGSWDVIDNAGALNGTAPHADFRDLTFQGNNVLVGSNDGGIYFIQNPLNSANNAWHAYIGGNGTGLADGEIHNIAWDSMFDVAVGGFQDNGTQSQSASGNSVWTHFQGGDGGDVQVDAVSLSGSAQTIRYASSQNLDSFTRYVFDSATNVVSSVALFPGNALPSNFTGTFVSHFELNNVDPAAGQSKSIVIGGGGSSPVYIGTMPDVVNNNTDVTWTAVGVPAGFGTVNAIVFGGSRNGTVNADVLWVGTGSGLFVRSTSGGALAATPTAFPGGGVTDIAVDPTDWQHVFAASSSGVWESTDAGANWTNRTGNLGNSNLQTLEYVDQGAVDALVAGGQGGVFRMITNNPGVWSEYGQFMPNAVTYDLEYNAADDILLAGTLGRGAWTVSNASATLTTVGVLQIFGDDDFFGEDDTIRLVRDANNTSLLDVFDNGVFSQYQFSTLQQIDVFGFGGNDTLIVDSSNGLINIGNGIRFDGDGGTDGLQLLQTGGPTYLSDTYSVGPAIGSGISAIVGGGTFGTQTVFFQNLDPVLDLVPVATLTVNATPEDNAVNYTGGTLVTQGKVTIDAYESIEFANKTSLVLNAGAGIDSINLNNAGTPTGLTGISVNGSDPNDGDTLNVTGVGLAVTVNTLLATITGATGAGGAVGISYGGIESLNLLAGIGALTFTTTAADDTLVVTPGASPAGSNSGTLQSNGAVPAVSFANSGAVTANLGAGNDAVLVNGSSLNDTVAVSGTAITITGRHGVSYTGVEAVRVNGQAGGDTFNVTPALGVSISIDGDDPNGAAPGDQLNIFAGGQSVTYNVGPQSDEGSFAVGANQPVSFDHIESFGITSSGPATINGTNGPDAITVIARDNSTHAGTDGVQDFTVSVNTGPELLFVDVSVLTVNGLSGSDQITLHTPAPNNAVWAVDVSVNGGPPAADTDRLIVQTPGAGAENVVYTPTAADGGTLNLTSLSSLITLTTTEVLSYDGQGDNDSLTIVGTGGDDTIVHTPGSTDQAGSFQVNSLLALTYQNLGGTGSLTAEGAGSNDTLVYTGSDVNDSFSIGAAGQVNLNSRLVVHTASIETLTLEGLGGDDTFTVVPALSASVYTAMNFNGGAQASATGDRAILAGTAGADTVGISGQVVSLGGNTVNGSGLEGLRFDALGGDDVLTYNGVSGVTENITVSSSGVAGGGQVSVPNVTLVDFSGVERIDVNGNAPTPTETDTLAFSGTNAVDVFQINLAAAGSDADPILKLQNAAATQTLLTLRNYTNFNTLRVNGLDGADTFNVYTGVGASRNVFIDGGSPTAKKKSTDNLNVFYTAPRPRIIHSAATQDPDAGLVDLDYGTARFLVQYDDIEQVVIRRS